MPLWCRIILQCLLVGMAGPDARAEQLVPQLRRPVDAVWLDPGRVLLTANSRSGSLSVVDVGRLLVVSEVMIGGQPVALLPLSANRLAVIDHSANTLRFLKVSRDPWAVSVETELPLLRGPNSIALVDGDVSDPAREGEAPAEPQRGEGIAPGSQLSGSFALPATDHATRVVSVASLWDRSLEKIELDLSGETATEVGRLQVQLSFAPREQLVLPGGKKLLVADNHAGKLAVIDIESWTIDAIRPLNAHNIRGLALNAERDAVLIAHQILNQQVTTGHDAVRDGTLMQNVVRVVPLAKLYDPQALLPVHVRTIFLGRASDGAADPADIVHDFEGNLCVALAGVDEMALVSSKGIEKQRPMVGRRPTKILPCPDRPEVLVVNTFGDSLTLVNTSQARVRRVISLGPQPELTRAERGELLFFDGRVSFENWMSCHSCHTDGHANGLLSDTLGDGTAGTPKRVQTLLGTRDANPWGWTGEVRELHEQVSKSIRSTMQGPPRPMTQVVDLVSYLHTLSPAPPLLPATDDPADRTLVEQGREVFTSAGCVRCHIPPLTYTTDSMFNVGLHDEAGRKLFNPPSLLGVSQRDSLFHDARAKTLEDVLEQGHFVQTPLTREEQAALVRFLKSL